MISKNNLVIADDHLLFTEGLSRLLAEGEKWTLTAVANSAEELRTLLASSSVDIVLLDLNLGSTDGLEYSKTLHEKYPELKIIILTSYDEPKLVRTAFKNGVDGYLLKSSGKQELTEAIESVLDGKTYLGDGVHLHHFHQSNNGSEQTMKVLDDFQQKNSLTKREIEVLQLISQALTNKEIGEKLYISDQTVSVHRKNLMRKLGVNNTASLVKIAYENALF